MKKFLSIALVLCILSGMLVFNASASVPTDTKAMWTKIVTEDFEGEWDAFSTKLGDTENLAVVPEFEGSDNNVIDLKFGDKATEIAKDGVTGYKLDNVRIGQGDAASDNLVKVGSSVKVTLPDDYIIELDVCGKNLIGALQVIVRSAANKIQAVNIDPNYMEEDVWYTYRIVVHTDATKDIDTSTTTVMRKLRDSKDDFEVIPVNKGFAFGNSWGNATVSMGVIASTPYCKTYISSMDKTTEKMAPTNSAMYDGYTAVLDTHYQLDNISIYGVGAKTKGEWDELIAENFDGETQQYFTTKFGASDGIEVLPEAEDNDNKVLEIKFGENFSNSNLLLYDNVRVGQGTVKTDKLTSDITLPDDYMIEFDACGVNPIGHLAVGFRDEVSTNWYAIKINPNYIEKDVWYTYRIYTESERDADGNPVANSNTHTVMRKLRGSDDAFETIVSDREYYKHQSYVNSTITLGVVAQKGYATPYIKGMNETTETRTAGTDTQTAYTEVTKSIYRIDDIKIYGKTVESYEMNGGIFQKYDMETADTTLTSGYLTTQVEANGNAYVKYTLPETAMDGKDYFTSLYKSTDDAANAPLPEKFVMSFDANNAELGFPLAFEIYGHGDGITDKGLPRYSFYIKSYEDTKDIWYSYKVVATGKWNKDNNFTFDIYRKERDKDEPYVLLTGAYAAGREGNWPKAEDNDYGLAQALSPKGANRNQFRFGDFRNEWMTAYPANEAGNANIGGVWYLDNIEFTDAAAVSGNVALSEGTIVAELNISAAADSKAVVAIYDGDTLVSAGVAEVTSEGKVIVDAEGFEEGYTAKLFVWDAVEGDPLLGNVIDITNLL